MPGRGLTLRLIATIADYEIGRAPVLSRRFGWTASYHFIPNLLNCGTSRSPAE